MLDNEGVSRAATERAMYVRLKVAHVDGRRVITSTAILAEVLRGSARDAGLHRVLNGVAVIPVTHEIGRNAGLLIGASGLGSEQAVDAMLAATALAEGSPAVVVTSDVPHLSRLLAGQKSVRVVHVAEIARKADLAT